MNPIRYVKLKAPFILFLPILLASCTAVQEESSANSQVVEPTNVVPSPEVTETPTMIPVLQLPDLGPAPDFNNEIWLNTDQPLNLESVRGKVVLVEFWTFG